MAIRAKFSAICQVRGTKVPEKFDVKKMWQFPQKQDSERWPFAQCLCDHWHIAAICQ
jgi:hypothetical protein